MKEGNGAVVAGGGIGGREVREVRGRGKLFPFSMYLLSC